MKRILHIARDHGVAALLHRALARVSARLGQMRTAAESGLNRRRAMRLPKSREPVIFAAAHDPSLALLITDARDWRRTNRCLAALRLFCEEIPVDVTIAHDPALGPDLQMHEGVRLLPQPESTPFRYVLEQAAHGRGRFLAIVHADAIPSRIAIARQLREMERDGKIVAIFSQGPVSGSMLRKEFLRTALPEMPGTATDAEAMAWLCSLAALKGLRCLCYESETGTLRFSPSAGELLVVDDHVPFDDRDAGSRRISALMMFAREAGWNVTFGSLDARSYEPYGQRLREAGVDLVLRFGTRALSDLTGRGALFDCAWLSRAHVAAGFTDAVRALQPRARIVYDTVDLHYLRLARQQETLSKRTSWAELERSELESARKSDAVVVTSTAEEKLLHEKDVRNVFVVGIAEAPLARRLEYDQTNGVLFLGNYSHEPNIDAALWLAREIMPLVWRDVPEAVLTLAGADPTAAIRGLASERIRVPGFTPSLDAMLQAARVFAAPLRFGAGLKGKIVQAIAAGVPVVTTAVGAEGIAGSGELAVADDTPGFAAEIVTLYTDQTEWQKHSEGARRAASRFTPEELARQFYSVLGASKG